MKVGYVVLYVNDAEACRRFWVEKIGMVEKRRSEAGTFTIAQVSLATAGPAAPGGGGGAVGSWDGSVGGWSGCEFTGQVAPCRATAQLPAGLSGAARRGMRRRRLCWKSSAPAGPGAAFRESLMKVGYVVLYVNDAEACRRFWVEQIGMVEKRRSEAGDFTIAQVGFADQPFAFELVPLELMKDNPDGLDLATPSIAFTVDDLEATHDALVGRGVQATDVGDHQGTPSFAFSDPEGRWFAVTQ